MKQFILYNLLIFIFLNATVTYGDIKEKEVQYFDGDTELRGYLVLPDEVYAAGKTPAVILVHEWWGHDEFVRDSARRIAEDFGVIAFALDMYGDGRQAKHPEDAKRFSGEILKTEGLREKRFRAALQHVQSLEDVDKEKIAAIGFCFGGSTVLDMARIGVPLHGVVSFHGGLDSKVTAQKVTARILVYVGERDSFLSDGEKERFQDEMRRLNAEAELLVLTGARHSFMNPRADEYAKSFGIDVGYHERAAELAWAGTGAFLRQIFSQVPKRPSERQPCVGCGVWDESSSVKR
ncbi:MAG: dienelactone hydrolase family protein [Bdellovibrionota bacterium]|jgi:dienelactone hydrolase